MASISVLKNCAKDHLSDFVDPVGPEEHQRSHQILSEEGSAALAGRCARATEDAASRLAEIRSSIKQRIDQANELGIGGSSRRYVIDLYPELLALTDQLLMKSGFRE